MFNFSKDLVRRALLVERKNGENNIFNITYTNKNGSIENFLARINRNEKDSSGGYAFFEIQKVEKCLIENTESYFSESADHLAGAVFKKNSRGEYTSQDNQGRGVATLIESDAKIYVSHILIESIYSSVPDMVAKDDRFSDLNREELILKIKLVQDIVAQKRYEEIFNDPKINYIKDQKKIDWSMAKSFP